MKTEWTVFTGTFTDSFFSMQFNTETLQESGLHTLYNPGGRSAFFARSSDSKFLFVANEFQAGAGGAAAFSLENGADPLFLNSQESESQGPAHISVMNVFGRDYLLGSGYFDGDIVVLPVSRQGTLMPASDRFRLQQGAHAHGIRQIPRTRFVLATDTEHNVIHTYEMTPEGKLVSRHSFSEPGFEAPRHMTFSLDGRYVYVVTERTSTMDVFSIDRENGALCHTDHFSNLPDGCRVESSSSAIHRSPDGKYVYCSNRGHDSITVYRTEEDGRVTKVGYAEESIKWPREFIIDPQGTCMLVGNQLDNSISVFRMNRESGIPEYTGKKIQLSEGPTCFAFV